jgi:ribulose 1,5-bisphosphate synthetase/thiazole synthase
MRRRKFIKDVLFTTGAGILGTQVGCSPGNIQNENNNNPEFSNSSFINEQARDIPVIAETDVLVIGGGPAGIAAAVSASRAGANTILVERYNHLGGLWTGGLVLPLLSTHAVDKNKQRRKVIYGIGDEIAQRLKNMNMAIHEINPIVDPEAAKYVLEVMIRDSGVEMLYHCWASNVLVENNRIEAVFLESKSGRVAILPKMVIDCTGDGDILHLAGENYTNLKYHIGLVHRLGNIDRVDTSRPGFKKMNIGEPTPLPSVNWVNMHGEENQDGTDLHTLSRLQQQYRIDIWERIEKIRSTPGYEKLFLLDTASQLGVRMSRILDGEYQLTLEDSMTYRQFDDNIGISGAWTTMLYNGKKITPEKRPLWQIPYRSLLPKKTENLVVAGRCFSFEEKLVEDTRIIGTCLITGHGAGAAAAVAVDSKTTAREVDIHRVQTVLKKQKAWLG